MKNHELEKLFWNVINHHNSDGSNNSDWKYYYDNYEELCGDSICNLTRNRNKFINYNRTKMFVIDRGLFSDDVICFTFKNYSFGRSYYEEIYSFKVKGSDHKELDKKIDYCYKNLEKAKKQKEIDENNEKIKKFLNGEK